MKKLFLCGLLALLQQVVVAQIKEVAQSNFFSAPESGYGQIQQMKNGNTVYLHFKKKGLDVRIYDDKHKEIAYKKLKPKFGKMKRHVEINGIFEVKGDVVFFIEKIDMRGHPVLYRVVVDGKTGDIKQDEIIGKLERLTSNKYYGNIYGGVPMPTFYVRDNENSDQYAVIHMESFQSDRNKRIEIVTYDDNHRETARAFMTSPQDKYKYLTYKSIVFQKGKTFVFGSAYNTEKSGGKESSMIVGVLEKGAKTIAMQEMKSTHNQVINTFAARYVPATGKTVVLLSTEEEGEKKKKWSAYATTFFDPELMDFTKSERVNSEGGVSYHKEIFGEKSNFNTVPVRFHVNSDGTFTVAFEEMDVITSTSMETYSVGNSMRSNSKTTTSTMLGSIAVNNYDSEGKLQRTYYLPKKAYLKGRSLYTMYNRANSTLLLEAENNLKMFDYISGSNKQFVFFNEIDKNLERKPKEGITTIQSVKACEARVFQLGESPIPKGELLFPELSAKSQALAVFRLSAYDEARNLFITVRLAKKGSSGQLVWLEI